MNTFHPNLRTQLWRDPIGSGPSISQPTSPLIRVMTRASRTVLGMALILGFCQGVGQAADITVTTALDSGAGSLRQALAGVPAGGAIDFDSGLGGRTIVLASELTVAKGVTIDASGLSGGVTLSGGGVTRLFKVIASGNLTLRGLTMTGGNGGGAADGGFGGAIHNVGAARVERCTLRGNSAANSGGSIHNAIAGSLTIKDNTFSGNSAGLYGGAVANSGTLTVSGSTFSGNSSGFEGGGIYSDFSSTLTLSNSTLTDNGAGFYGGAVFNGGPRLILNSATLVGNHAERIGGGIYNDFFGTPTSNLSNTIVAGNTAPESTNIFGSWAGGNNLTDGDPKLSPLGDWGGPTQTMPPLPNSPAIDAGGATALSVDQRGLPRVLNGGPDIGAFESSTSNYNPVGLTIHARVPVADPIGNFEISTDPDFLPVVGTLAGTALAETGTYGFADDVRLSAKFGYPSGVARDSLGNLFIADTGNNLIRMLGTDGTVSTVAGSGDYGLAIGSGPSAAFAFPSAVAVGPDDNVYVADTYNHRICKVTRPAVPGGVWTVTNLAGTGIAGWVEGAGTVARFNFPYGLALDPDGNVYVADSLNHRIRKVTPAGAVSTFAGFGTAGFRDDPNAAAAEFDTPQGVAIVGGSLYVADTFNDRIRKVAAVGNLAGEVSTVAGSSAGFADGTGAAARFDTPSGIATDGAGSLYVADEQNHRIRQLTLAGEVTTVAGTGVEGLHNGKSNVARFKAPTGVAVGLDGNLVVADSRNHVLRRILIKPLTVPSTPVSGSTNADGIQVAAVLDVVALGLDPGGKYYFRWKPITGTAQPLAQSFLLYDIPVVVTQAAGSLAPAAAELNADVDPKNSPTVVTFEYSTDPGLLKPYEVTTPAGSGVAGFANATGAAARFSNPSGVVTKANGDVFVADRLNHRIRKITAAGVVTTIAGSGAAGFADANGAAAQFEKPTGIAIDGGGNLYVADESNHRIRKITAAGDVTTFAGTGVAGFADGAAADAKFLYPAGVAVDADGNVYVADSGNQRIRKITAATPRMVTTLAGTGIAGFIDGELDAARFSSPQALAMDASGQVLVADTGNHRIRVIAASGVTTLAGSGVEGFLDGPGGSALFSSPKGIAVDGDGIAYVADGGNHRIRRIATDGQVTTLAGSGTPGQTDSPVVGLYPATASQFDLPVGIAVDGAGGLLVTQEGLLRKIARSGTLPTVTVTPDATGAGVRSLSVAVDQPLLYGATYYFQARGTNYRASVTGGILSFVTPYPVISVFAGNSSSAPVVTHQQADAIDFGNTPTGQPVTRDFTLANPGGWPLTVSAVDLPAGFQLTGGVGVIDPLNSLTFTLMLPATSAGSFSGDVLLTSDAPERAVFSFPVSGRVLDPPVLTTLAATAAGTGTATFNASVNPMGSSTKVWFEWSQDPEFDGVMVSILAGSAAGYGEGVGEAAKFNQPSGIAIDAGGNTYVADRQNHRIRKITPDGTTSTFAGTGVAGYADGPGTTAEFNQPVGLAMSAGGILFVADSSNHRIRTIDSAGAVSTYSGLGTPGFTDGITSAARFHTPSGLAIDGFGMLYVADSGNHRIRKVAADGSVTTMAGTGVAGSANGVGTVAQFNAPVGIARDSSGWLYVTEAASHAVRKIAVDGFTSVFAGSPTSSGMVDASGTAARFSNPTGLAVGVSGDIYVADKGNHRIRKISPTGGVTTVAGSGTSGTADGIGEVARFSSPFSLAATGSGALVVGEAGNSTLRRITSLQVLLQAAVDLTGTVAVPVELPVTGLPTTYYFRAIATNGGGTTIGAAPTDATFQAWRVSKFGADAGNPLIAGPLASPAGDGVSNLLKYAFGLDPLVAVTGGMPVMGLSGGSLSLTYTKVLAATDLLYTVEWSSDLSAWSPLGITEQVLSGNTATQRIFATVPAAPVTARFLRLHVTLQ